MAAVKKVSNKGLMGFEPDLSKIHKNQPIMARVIVWALNISFCIFRTTQDFRKPLSDFWLLLRISRLDPKIEVFLEKTLKFLGPSNWVSMAWNDNKGPSDNIPGHYGSFPYISGIFMAAVKKVSNKGLTGFEPNLPKIHKNQPIMAKVIFWAGMLSEGPLLSFQVIETQLDGPKNFWAFSRKTLI